MFKLPKHTDLSDEIGGSTHVFQPAPCWDRVDVIYLITFHPVMISICKDNFDLLFGVQWRILYEHRFHGALHCTHMIAVAVDLQYHQTPFQNISICQMPYW